MLTGVRVVDLSQGIAGPYCTKLLADAGADVVKVERPSGDPLRAWSWSARRPEGEDGAWFQFLNASKRSVVIDPNSPEGQERLAALTGDALLLVDNGPSLEGPDLEDSALTHLSITPWGRVGPWADRPGNDFTLQAQAGSTDWRGVPGEEPVSVDGWLGELAAGSFAAPAALAAVLEAARTGVGSRIDVSIFECMMHAFQTYRPIFDAFDPGVDDPRSIEIPSLEPASDGWVGICTITAQQWQDFCLLMGAPEWADDDELATFDGRMDRREEVWARVRAFTEQHTIDELVEKIGLLRIPVGPVGTGDRVADLDHMVERGIYIENPAGFIQPRAPYRIAGLEPRPLEAAPTLGEHTDAVEPAGSSPLRGPRLRDLVVADFSTFWAGPMAASFFTGLGADVIHVESVQRPDMMRYSSGLRVPQMWERSPVFHGANAGKRSLTVDLGSTVGADLARRLIERADIVIENYSPRVVEGFGLGWDAVHELNPRAVMVRMPAFGLDGPWRDRVGFAMTIEQITGLAWRTGHPDGVPMVPRGTCDPIAGMHAAFAALLALEHRERTNEGSLVEVPLLEVGLNLAAEQVIEWSAYGARVERTGNRSGAAAPQGLYESVTDDRWVALSVENDEQWGALVAVLGEPDWAMAPNLAHGPQRQAEHDRIDDELRRWFRSQTPAGVAQRLTAAGVPAAEAVNARRSGDSPQLAARGFFQWLEHPVAGWTPYLSLPFRRDGSYPPYPRHAPSLGEHNEEILGAMLGLSVAEIDRLRADQVIGTEPVFG